MDTRARGWKIVVHNVNEDSQPWFVKWAIARDPIRYNCSVEPNPEANGTGFHCHTNIQLKNAVAKSSIIHQLSVLQKKHTCAPRPPEETRTWGRVHADTLDFRKNAKKVWADLDQYLTKPNKLKEVGTMIVGIARPCNKRWRKVPGGKYEKFCSICLQVECTGCCTGCWACMPANDPEEEEYRQQQLIAWEQRDIQMHKENRPKKYVHTSFHEKPTIVYLTE